MAPFNLLELDPSEQTLYTEVKDLPDTDAKQAEALKLSKTQQRERRYALGERLFQLKASLSKPGRGSGWADFLRHAGIGVRKADRWVEAYAKKLRCEQNSDTVLIPATPEQISAAATRLLPTLRRLLVTADNLYSFIDLLMINW